MIYERPSYVERKIAQRGTCRHCERRRLVFSIHRQGGGTYRRGGRSYSSSICGGCAVSLLSGASQGAMSADRFDLPALVRIVASLGTDEANDLVDRWRQAREHYRIVRDLRRAWGGVA